MVLCDPLNCLPHRSYSQKRKPFKKGPGKRSDRPDQEGNSADRKSPFKKFGGHPQKGKPFGGEKSGRASSSGGFRGKPPFKKFEKNEKPFRSSSGPLNTDSSDSKDRSDFSKRPARPFSKDHFTRRQDDSAGSKSEGKRFSKSSERRGTSSFKSKVDGRRPGNKRVFVDSGKDKQIIPKPNADFSVPPEGLIRLNKFISNSGICSRREADELITAGVITVNGKSITELGHKVKPTDDVRYEGKRLKSEKPVYILLNKPKGFITTTDDPQERNTVMHLIQGACKERVYPVGRLDRNTSGLLLLTNDGDLTEKLTHPSYEAKKIYKVELDKPITKTDFQKILDGVRLEEGKAQVDELAIISDDGKTVGLEIHIGWNRVVRRIFEALDYVVVKLDRTVYATLDKKDLQRGHWRFLRQDEVIRLKHFQ